MVIAHGKHNWQIEMANLVTQPRDLLQLLNLHMALLPAAEAAAAKFPLRVPRRFLERVQKGDINDPLLMQILPIHAELQPVAGYVSDPLGEASANPISGVLHKYHGRVLVTLTSACAVHCRYCFRREFPYDQNNPGTRGWDAIYNYLHSDETISEVILSGGDPLSVPDRLLQQFTDKLAHVPHIKRLRIHSRLPIVLPERITDEFVAWLRSLKWNSTLVIHANHPNEINQDVISAIKMLRACDTTILNQSVLLKGVNDHPDCLIALSEKLFAAGVLPYYLHVLDKVNGASHFDVSREKAHAIYREMQKRLPGYLLPKLATEEPGKPSKTILSTNLYTG